MHTLRDAQYQELAWVQPKWAKREYQLVADNEVLAHLCWESGWGSRASAEAAEGRWQFKRGGFFRPQITITAADSGAEVAVFRASWNSSGTLTYADGHAFVWGKASFWGTQWEWKSVTGTSVMRLGRRSRIGPRGMLVELAPEARTLSEPALLAALGRYLIILAADQATVSASATTGMVF